MTELNKINFDEDIVIEDEYQKQQDRDYHDNLNNGGQHFPCYDNVCRPITDQAPSQLSLGNMDV